VDRTAVVSAGVKIVQIGRFESALIAGPKGGIQGVGSDRSGLDAVLHAIALALDDDGFGMVEDAVESRLHVPHVPRVNAEPRRETQP
jgi:hypothetical protein